MSNTQIGGLMLIMALLNLSITILESVYDLGGYVLLPFIAFLAFFFTSLHFLNKSKDESY